MRRGPVTGVLVVQAFVLALAACTVGPAAGRAERARPADTPGLSPPAAVGGGGEATRSALPGPGNQPAAPHGAAEVTATVALPPSFVEGHEPCCVAELPDGDLLVGVRETGVLYRVAPTNGGAATEVGAVLEVTLDPGNALLGLAVDPDQPDQVYVSYARASTVVVGRHSYYASEPPGEQLGPYVHAFVRDVPPGGAAPIAFGPDGMLYAATGGGTAGDAWDPATNAGKILRMTPFGEVPDDNPYPGSFVYALGLAEPTGLAWDDAGRLWVADDGGVATVVVPGRAPWPVWQGAHDRPQGRADGVPEGGEGSEGRRGEGEEGEGEEREGEEGGGGDGGEGARGGPAVAGLAFAAGALWLPAADGSGLWRVPLDGGTGLAGPAQTVPLGADDRAGSPVGEPRVLVDGRWLVTAGGGLARLRLSRCARCARRARRAR